MSALQVGRRGNKSVERRGGNLCDSEERLKEVSRGGGSKSEREERKTTRQGKTPLPAGYFTCVFSRKRLRKRSLFATKADGVIRRLGGFISRPNGVTGVAQLCTGLSRAASFEQDEQN